jgi:hypothetical protein
MLLLDLARLRDRSGGRAAATLDAQAAAAVLASLDVVLDPDDASSRCLRLAWANRVGTSGTAGWPSIDRDRAEPSRRGVRQ